MRRSLVLHADAPCAAISQIIVDIDRTKEGGLLLQYGVSGLISDIRLAQLTPSERAHQLWRHSCFEVFARISGQSAYQEYNFAPSSHWAAYGFASRRSGMRDLDISHPPHIETQICEREFSLKVAVHPLALPAGEPWEIGLSVIIEETSGSLSFWALSHPDGAADFHHDDCFALTLPPPELTL